MLATEHPIRQLGSTELLLNSGSREDEFMPLKGYGVLKGTPIRRVLGQRSNPHYHVLEIDEETRYRDRDQRLLERESLRGRIPDRRTFPAPDPREDPRPSARLYRADDRRPGGSISTSSG